MPLAVRVCFDRFVGVKTLFLFASDRMSFLLVVLL